MRGILVIACLLLVAPALAQTGAELAEQAAEAHAVYCADTAAGDVGLTSQAVARVGEVWDRVAQVENAAEQPFLLYWRAKLGECLGHPGLASADYTLFVQTVGDSAMYAGLAKDAARRIKRIDLLKRRQQQSGPLPEDVVLVIGGTSAGVAGVFGGLAAQQWGTLLEQYSILTQFPQSESAYQAQFDDLQQLDRNQQGFGVAAFLTGAASAGVLIAGAVAKDRAARGLAFVVPSPGGARFTVAGRF